MWFFKVDQILVFLLGGLSFLLLAILVFLLGYIKGSTKRGDINQKIKEVLDE